jgi:hypothetical protein
MYQSRGLPLVDPWLAREECLRDESRVSEVAPLSRRGSSSSTWLAVVLLPVGDPLAGAVRVVGLCSPIPRSVSDADKQDGHRSSRPFACLDGYHSTGVTCFIGESNTSKTSRLLAMRFRTDTGLRPPIALPMEVRSAVDISEA